MYHEKTKEKRDYYQCCNESMSIKEKKTMSSLDPKKPEHEPHQFSHDFFELIHHHKWDAGAYILLFCGLLLCLFKPFLGAAIVGLVVGIYFSRELRDRSIQFKDFIVHEGVFRAYVLIVTLIALLILTPGLIIGFAVGAFIRPAFPFGDWPPKI